MLRSEHILKGLGNQYYRATYKSMGFTTEDLKRPLIGIANAWSECVPGHYNLRQVAQRVKDGIYRAGGTPIEFGVIGGCDGMGQGHDGMHFIMPSRSACTSRRSGRRSCVRRPCRGPFRRWKPPSQPPRACARRRCGRCSSARTSCCPG